VPKHALARRLDPRANVRGRDARKSKEAWHLLFSSERPQRLHPGGLDVEEIVEPRNRRKHQYDEENRCRDHVREESTIPIELLGMLNGAVRLQPDVKIVREDSSADRSKEEQLEMVADEKDARKQRTGGLIEEQAHHQPFLRVPG
jgi:hypothetical protein